MISPKHYKRGTKCAQCDSVNILIENESMSRLSPWLPLWSVAAISLSPPPPTYFQLENVSDSSDKVINTRMGSSSSSSTNFPCQYNLIPCGEWQLSDLFLSVPLWRADPGRRLNSIPGTAKWKVREAVKWGRERVKSDHRPRRRGDRRRLNVRSPVAYASHYLASEPQLHPVSRLVSRPKSHPSTKMTHAHTLVISSPKRPLVLFTAICSIPILKCLQV